MILKFDEEQEKACERLVMKPPRPRILLPCEDDYYDDYNDDYNEEEDNDYEI